MADYSYNVGEYTVRCPEAEMKGEFPDIFPKYLKNIPYIYRENLLTIDEVNLIYKNALKNFVKRAYATVHDYSTGAAGTRLNIDGRYTHNIPCDAQVYSTLNNTLENRIYPLMQEHYEITGKLQLAESWQVLGYGQGYFFGNHCDNCIWNAPGHDEQLWWTNTPKRKYSTVIWVNDQVEGYSRTGQYVGGSFVLTRVLDADKKSVVIKPKAGSMITFPSNFQFMHEVRKVLRGYRISCVAWHDAI